jgi:hypothetical protein
MVIGNCFIFDLWLLVMHWEGKWNEKDGGDVNRE